MKIMNALPPTPNNQKARLSKTEGERDVSTKESHTVLSAYSAGNLSRSEAMKQLNLSWYGDLLDALAQSGLNQPIVSDEDRARMVKKASEILGEL